jgi:hypothetical protein
MQFSLAGRGKADCARLPGLDSVQNGNAGVDHRSARRHENPEERTCHHKERFNDIAFNFLFLILGAHTGKRIWKVTFHEFDFLIGCSSQFSMNDKKQCACRGRPLPTRPLGRFPLPAHRRSIC